MEYAFSRFSTNGFCPFGALSVYFFNLAQFGPMAPNAQGLNSFKKPF